MKKFLNGMFRRERGHFKLLRKASWIGHILRRNCLHVTIEGLMMEVKEVGKEDELSDDLRNRIRH
jgi:hypothetical protein